MLPVFSLKSPFSETFEPEYQQVSTRSRSSRFNVNSDLFTTILAFRLAFAEYRANNS